MNPRAIVFLLALAPLAAGGSDQSPAGTVSAVSAAGESPRAAGIAPLAIRVNGKKVAKPVELRLPPAGGCVDATQVPCDNGERNNLGDAAATFNYSESAALLDWMTSIWREEAVDVEARVVEPDGDVRRILHRRTLITQLELGTTITLQWLPQAVKDSGGPRTIEGVKRNPAKFVVTYPPLKLFPVLDATMPVIRPQIVEDKDANTRRPLLHYGDIEIGDLMIEIGAAGYKSAEALAMKVMADGKVDESEYSDVQVAVVDNDEEIARLLVSAAPVGVILSDDGERARLRLLARSVRMRTTPRPAK